MTVTTTFDPVMGYNPQMDPPTGGMYALTPAVQNSSPSNGATVVMTQDSRDQFLYLTPAAVIAGVTVAVPSNAVSRKGQIIRIGSTRQITLLSFSGSNILNYSPSILDAGTVVSFMKVADDTWFQL